MSVHRKPNGTWFVQYRVPGEKHPRREYFGVGPDGEQKAKVRDAEIKLRKAQGRPPVEPCPRLIYLDTLAQLYMTERKTRGASARWIKEFANLLNRYILPALTAKPVDALTYQDVIRLVEDRWGKRSLATRQRYMGYLKAVFRFGVEHGLSVGNPLAKWRKVKEPKHDLRLTVEDLGRILAHAPAHLAWAIEVEWELGTRPGASELFALRWADVDFEACQIRVRGTKTHASNRLLPITPEFRGRLAVMREAADKAQAGRAKDKAEKTRSEYVIEYAGRRVGRLTKALRRAAKKAGIEYRVRMYDIRHLFASTMLAGGADLAAVSKLLGHSTITTTQQNYYHLLQGEMARAIRTRPRLGKSLP